MAKIEDIEGIGEGYAQKLKGVGISRVDFLLEMCASAAGRKIVAEQTGINDTLLLRWVNHADLFRIKGIAGQYAELLEVAGVDSVPELAHRKAENLYQKMVEVNQAKAVVRKLPTQSQVTNWIEQAQTMAKVVTH